MALEGSLDTFALPDIIQMIGLQKKTGVLRLTSEEDEVTIAFKDGLLVSADSKAKRLESRLGTLFVRGELITEGQLQDALESQKQTLQRIGVILVHEGLVKQADLRQALVLQVKQTIFRVFRWESGNYSFDPDEEIDFDRENFIPMSAESILMEAAQAIDEWPLVEKVVRSSQAVFEKVPLDVPVEVEGSKEVDPDDDDFDFDLGGGGGGGGGSNDGGGDTIKLSPDEGQVYELLDGQRSVEDIVYLARISEFEVSKLVYDLVTRDLVREASASVGAGPAGTSSATAAIAAPAAVASPFVVGVGIALVLLLALAGARFWPMNPIPLNGENAAGISPADVTRQASAAALSRLERVAFALEAHSLAHGRDGFAESLEDLADLEYYRSIDMRNPWGSPFEYTVLDNGKSFRLQATGAEDAATSELQVRGGQLARRGQ